MLGLAAPSPNSLRDLRSLRSDSVDESEDEARCARGHEPCASRHLRGAPPPARARLCWTSGGLRDETNQRWTSRQALPVGGDFCGDEKRSARVGARERASW